MEHRTGLDFRQKMMHWKLISDHCKESYQRSYFPTSSDTASMRGMPRFEVPGPRAHSLTDQEKIIAPTSKFHPEYDRWYGFLTNSKPRNRRILLVPQEDLQSSYFPRGRDSQQGTSTYRSVVIGLSYSQPCCLRNISHPSQRKYTSIGFGLRSWLWGLQD